MRQTAFLFAAILLLAASAGAQANPDDSLPLAPVAPGDIAATAPPAPSLLAMNPAPALTATSTPGAAAFATPSSSPTDQQQPSVYGVFQNYNWQATAGYTFFRFYFVPRVTLNLNGLNLGMVYYPGGHWYAADGEFVGAWGSLIGYTAKYVQGMGGGRVRWSAPRGIEVWGHVLVGGSHFLPQTAYGNQSAFTYEAGAGVDLNIHQKRIAYRVSSNMVGTRYFNTYQYSPNVNVGVVFKF